jgi:hypothetical protein
MSAGTPVRRGPCCASEISPSGRRQPLARRTRGDPRVPSGFVAPTAQRPVSSAALDAETRFREALLLLSTALAFAAAKTALVILVEPAIDRYMTAAITFLPPALAVYAARYIEAAKGRWLLPRESRSLFSRGRPPTAEILTYPPATIWRLAADRRTDAIGVTCGIRVHRPNATSVCTGAL